jgi:hypothetical protein
VVDDKAIYKQAFWLYGVVIGLSIKEALDSVVPHWVHPSAQTVHIEHALYLEILRLFTFLFLTIRFYLGSAYYFGIAHEADDVAKEFPKRNFATDFVLGFLHFLGFVLLALTINVHTEPVRLFPLAIVFVLGYDVFWFLFTIKLDTTVLIKWWAIVNGVILVVCAVIYLLVERITQNPMRAEIWALWLVFVSTLFDIGWMMQKKPFFEPIRDWLMGKRRTEVQLSPPQ